MRKSVILLGLFLTILFSVTAQSQDWYMNKPVVDITFDGLENVNPSELEGIKVQIIGKPFDENLFLDLQSKLYSLNYFESFEASALPGDDSKTTVILNFKVVERPLVENLVFRGNAQLRDTALEDVVITKVDDILNNARIRIDAEAIKELYVSEGFADVVVDGSYEDVQDSNKVNIVFEIEEGSQTKVEEILFSGNSFASSSTLKRLLQTKEQTLFNKGIYEENNLASDEMAILSYYFERGYIDAKIIEISKDVQQDEDGKNLLTLTFYLEEGAQYTFGGLTFDGNTLFSNETLESKVKSESGKILNKSRVEADLIRVSDLYYNDGYIFNQIVPEEVRDDENHVVSFVIHIREEGRAHIENISVTGNDKTEDYVILREIPLEVGDVFSKDKIMEGLNNLANLQYFETFIPETPQGSAPGLMDLIINVEEGRTTDINFGVTFTLESGQFPILGFLKWTDSNLNGTGQEISIGTELSGTTQSLTLSYSDNWLFGKRISGGVNFNIEHNLNEDVLQDLMGPVFSGTTDENPQMVPDPFDGHWVDADTGVTYEGTPSDDEIDDGDVVTDYTYAMSEGESIDDAYLMEYEDFEVSLGGNMGYSMHLGGTRTTTATGLTAALNYLTYDDNIYRAYDPSIREDLNTWQLVNNWWGSVSFDTRDIIYSPNNGYFFKQTVSYTGGILFGSDHYNKLTSIAEAFFTLADIPVSEDWDFNLVLALHTNLSLVLPQYHMNDDGVWENSIDASSSDLLYTDGMTTAKGWSVQSDGEAMWDTWAELRMPIVPGYINFNNFISATAFYEDRTDMLSMGLDDFMFSMGSGIQISLPSFPMGFYLVKRFEFEDNAISWQGGDVFADSSDSTSGLDFVIAFTFSYY